MPAVFERSNERFEITGHSVFSVNESNAHVAAGLAGLGIIHTFAYTVQKHIESGALIPLLEEWRPAPYPFHVVYSPNRYLSHRVRVFIDWLVERFLQQSYE